MIRLPMEDHVPRNYDLAIDGVVFSVTEISGKPS